MRDDAHWQTLMSELYGWEVAPMPCCICGEESDAYASFCKDEEEGEPEWLCESCCDDDEEGV